jgi:hypothetical protein
LDLFYNSVDIAVFPVEVVCVLSLCELFNHLVAGKIAQS